MLTVYRVVYGLSFICFPMVEAYHKGTPAAWLDRIFPILVVSVIQICVELVDVLAVQRR